MLLIAVTGAGSAEPLTQPSVVTITKDGRLEVNGSPFLLIGTAPGPRPLLRTPEGRDGWQELAAGGINVVRGVTPLDDPSFTRRQVFDAQLEAAARNGIYTWPNLRGLSLVGEEGPDPELIKVVHQYKVHPGVLMWKTEDEPEWGKKPAAALVRGYELIHQLDPAHPVWICHAPRGTLDTLRPYSAACDVLSHDIYPISEPLGKHAPADQNHGLSMVGDYTSKTVALCARGQMPMMVLQACWSGVNPNQNPKNKLMFPSFREERYMMYQSFICGSNGFSFFGLTFGLTGRDYDLGWNWTWWRAVLRPLLAEIKPGTELWPVMTAPETTFPLAFNGAPQIEVRTKVLGPYVYIFSAAREGAPVTVSFSSSGFRSGDVSVLHENRTLHVRDGAFTDSLAEHEVHIYRVPRYVPSGEIPKLPETLERDAERARTKRASGATTGTITTSDTISEIHIPQGAMETTGSAGQGT